MHEEHRQWCEANPPKSNYHENGYTNLGCNLIRHDCEWQWRKVNLYLEDGHCTNMSGAIAFSAEHYGHRIRRVQTRSGDERCGSAPRIDPYRHPSATRCSSPPLLRYAPQLRP